MVTEILSVVFVAGVPMWLVVEELLHRRPVPVRGAPARKIAGLALERLDVMYL